MRNCLFARGARPMIAPSALLVLAGALAWGALPRAAAARRPGPIPSGPAVVLTAAEVEAVVRAAAEAVAGEEISIVVVDRQGTPLADCHRHAATDAEDELALSLARTGVFFSNDQAPLSSRTVRFLSGIHFPPRVRNQPNAALYGIENTNRVDYNVTFNPGKEYPPPLNLEEDGPSLGITTGKADLFDSVPRAVNPGGVPIFKDGRVAGGVGVAGVTGPAAEFAAFTGSLSGAGFGPQPAPPGVIFADGIALPFVNQMRRPANTTAGSFPGTGDYRPGFEPEAGSAAPDGYLVGPAGSTDLPLADVERIVDQSVAIAERTRALIRLPIGQRTRMVIAVGDLAGNILALFRMADSTIFSLDVAVAKSRNVVYFSGLTRDPSDLPGLPVGTAVTNRTISFGAQPLFPAGINGTRPGPFFDLFVFDSLNPGTQGMQPDNPNQNGVVFFPGSVPLYQDGVLVGGLGISGDGVEQDVIVAFHGAKGFHPSARIRADRRRIRGVRMPYLKFPRNPLR